MNIYIKKTTILLFAIALIFTSCENEETFVLTNPAPSFVLQQPSINSVFLNFGTPDNAAITLSWNDNLTNSSSYDVEMALEPEFGLPINLGSVEGNSFTINVKGLNEAIRSTGVTDYVDITTYFRINGEGTLSNNIQYLVTTYPIELPKISSPINNDAFVLSLDSADEIAMTVTWSDEALSSPQELEITYSIEAAAAGTDFTNPVSIGSGTNITSITSTHSDLNAVAIGIGLTADIAGDMDIRVVASYTNKNGNELVRTSETITISVTPYNVSFPNLYLVGDATTPGWNPDNNNTVVFRNQDVPNAYVFTGYFGAGAFKMLETTAWQPQWGTNDGSTLAVNRGGGSDPGTFNVATAGYYTYNFTTVGDAGSFTVVAYDASAAPVYPTIGIIGDATPGGWGSDTDFTQDPNNPHLWFVNGVTLTNGGSMLIRANDAWDDVWRYTGSNELYGTAILAGGGDNIPFNAPTGSYDIWFNDLDGSYNIIPN
ncbi:SusE domain-containing protein [Tamlana sp. 2201CG12-4]|uniref:SusE domain-containing protein n=1 Tax=Tamlana sp. 2201CG12-4 TaxID=3112582 RepID=UPI002DB73547|nr:SusE domain-containing protein [Tamlana sp. 2201CG12-4]MEC3906759.1 SusE domain-containing protein [Tamlana sp. 2201CG12-4]